MSAPNIVSITSLYGKTVGAALTTNSADLLANLAASGKVLKVNACYVANVDGTNDAMVTLAFYDASVTTSYKLTNTITVPADATLDVLSKPIYLEEGDKITGLASADSDLEVVISYEEIA